MTKEELEEENAELKSELNRVSLNEQLAVNNGKCFLKHIAELEAQIEKMKCCYNCKHSRTEYEHCKTEKSEKWEIKEND